MDFRKVIGLLTLFFTFALTSFASVTFLTFHTSTILAPLWSPNWNVADSRTFPFPRCLADWSCLAWSKMSNNIEDSQYQFEKKDICKYQELN